MQASLHADTSFLDVLQQFAHLCDLPQYANGLIILKKDDRQFTLTTKKTLHLIFKATVTVTADYVAMLCT